MTIPQGEQPSVAISRRALVGVYAIVPLSIALVLADTYLFGGKLKRVLPSSPDALIGFTLVFNAPHLIASEFTLFDREYFAHYRRQILTAAPLSILAVLLVWFAATPAIANMINVTATNYHLMAQQVGLTRPITGYRGRWLELWKWMAIALFIAAFSPVFFQGPGGARFVHYIWAVALIAQLPMIFVAYRIFVAAPNTLGKLYVLGNQALFVAMIPFALSDYTFFLIVVPRLIHDTTAYSFYVVHDRNRNQTEAHNLIYRSLRFTGLPIWLIFPLGSVAIAYVLSNAFHGLGLFFFIGPIALFHYFMEGVMWKGSAPHRSAIRFA